MNKSKIVHNDRYDYSLVNYINAKKKIKIICDRHGEFEQSPTKHLTGNGCPICKSSKGENKIFNILLNKGIKFSHHHKLIKSRLEFDFYLEEMKIAIEYDGLQHFEPVNRFGGIKVYKKQIIRDKTKDKYCIDNNICLLRIPYTKFNDIEIIIDEFLQ